MQINWNDVRAVILDLGGVILNIDYQLTIDAFHALGFESFEEQYSKLQQSGLFDGLETGQISRSAFITTIQQQAPDATAAQVIHAWNALLLDFPEGRIETIEQIATRWPTFLLSNTNEIHYEAFNQTFQSQTGRTDIKPLFQKAYLSSEIGMRKPDAEAFEIILHENDLKAEQVLFVDDSPQHVEGAKKLGIQGYHLVEPERLEDLFAAFLA
ncbi:MAG: HAD family phosphatase [Flavobacteriales bacterium]|nr:HAD family phosphatase [Flavobacteriales bacterium]